MALMEWDDTMSVGVAELDEQHKELIELINEAYESIRKHDEQHILELIDKMQDYAAMHFRVEEAYLKEYGYPDLEEHKFKHAQFSQEVEDFQKKQFESTNLSSIFVFLSRWLTSHIMDEDKKFIPYMPKAPESEQ